MFLLDDSNEVTAANKMRDVHFRFSIYMPEKKSFLYSNEIGHFVTCKSTRNPFYLLIQF